MQRTMRHLGRWTAAAGLLALASATLGREARVDPTLPEYARTANLSGVLRVTASADTADIARALGDAFQAAQPDVSVQVSQTGTGDVNIATGDPREAIRIASQAIGVYVHKDNPVQGLTRAQVTDLFASATVARWGALGVAGPLADITPTLIGPAKDSDERQLLADLVGQAISPAVKTEPGSAAVVNGVGADSGAAGFALVSYATRRTRVVPVAARQGGPFVTPSPQTCADGSYPLSRPVILTISGAAPPAAAEFARFALARQGQQAAAEAGAVSLPAPVAATERGRIK
jgi:phosphate transport system substrate-binding protein